MKELPEKIDSKFRYVLLAARRAEQMMQGAQPRIILESEKTTRVAMEEIKEEAVAWDYGPEAVTEGAEGSEGEASENGAAQEAPSGEES